jgi:hypothetical protein
MCLNAQAVDVWGYLLCKSPMKRPMHEVIDILDTIDRITLSTRAAVAV